MTRDIFKRKFQEALSEHCEACTMLLCNGDCLAEFCDCPTGDAPSGLVDRLYAALFSGDMTVGLRLRVLSERASAMSGDALCDEELVARLRALERRVDALEMQHAVFGTQEAQGGAKSPETLKGTTLRGFVSSRSS